MSTTPEYRVWQGMLDRCHNPKNYCYHKYGAKGIQVCNAWRFGEGDRTPFECFISDMGRRPSTVHSIDRFPDQAGNYEPNNCRWATPKQQANNTKRNRFIKFGGVTLNLNDWSAKAGIRRELLAYRLNNGWTVERALTTPSSFGNSALKTALSFLESWPSATTYQIMEALGISKTHAFRAIKMFKSAPKK